MLEKKCRSRENYFGKTTIRKTNIIKTMLVKLILSAPTFQIDKFNWYDDNINFIRLLETAVSTF